MIRSLVFVQALKTLLHCTAKYTALLEPMYTGVVVAPNACSSGLTIRSDFMKSKHILAMAGVVAIGLSGLKVMAMGDDTTNKYLNTTSPAGSCGATLNGSGKVERSVLIESSSSSPA